MLAFREPHSTRVGGLLAHGVRPGIGSSFHEEPQGRNYGRPKRVPRLVPGMTIAIEPMVSVGGPRHVHPGRQWTVVTSDGSLSAHFEHTVAVAENGAPAPILTVAE